MLYWLMNLLFYMENFGFKLKAISQLHLFLAYILNAVDVKHRNGRYANDANFVHLKKNLSSML